MAFTGKKVKGSRILTPETIENRKTFYKLMEEIKQNNEELHNKLMHEMFWGMFEHLSHSSQKEFLEWAEIEELNSFMIKTKSEFERCLN